MKEEYPYSINIRGELRLFSSPLVMGILNVTPDSFYSLSRATTSSSIKAKIDEMLVSGADIIDVGGCSTRPGFSPVTEAEERERLVFALDVIARDYPDAIISVDTYRSDIARMCVEEYGVSIVNDVSGGMLDDNMYKTVSSLGVPYVLTHANLPSESMVDAHYDDVMLEMMYYFSLRIQMLRDLGQKDIIIDPGFGISKNVPDSYTVLSHLNELKRFGLPILAGLSRKRMIREPLSVSAEESGAGTIAAETIALMQGASILRTHDVKSAKETVKIFNQTKRH